MATGGIKVHVYGDYDDKDIKKAIRDLQSLQTQAGPTEKASNGVAAGFKAMAIAAAGVLSVSAVADYLRDAATAAMEDEKSMVALATAMDNVNQGFANASTERFVAELAASTGVADDALRPALSRLITATGDAAEAQGLLTTALDISTATGRDLVSVSQALARASTGQVSALTRLGIPLDQNIVKSKDFAAALDVLNNRFGGQAAAAAQTYAGQLARLQVAAGEAQETIGYALLGAIDSVGDAFGGVGGATAVLQGFADKVADNITILGRFATTLADISKIGASDGGQGPFGSLFSALTMTGPEIIDQAINRMDYAINYALGNAEAAEAAYNRINGIVNDGTKLFAPLVRLRDIAVQTLGEQEQAAQDFEDAIAAIRDEVRDLQGTLSNNQSMDNFAKSLRDIDEQLKGNSRSLKGMSDSALENRDALRSAFSDAAGVVQGFVDEGRISADEFASVFAGTGKKIVDDFARQGFTRKEIKAFLKSEGLWTEELAAIFSATNNKKALDESERLGYDIASGISVGVSLGAPQVKRSAQSIIADAIASAKTTYKIKSPSEVTRDELGLPLAQGIVEGLRAGGDEVRKAMQDQFLTAFTEVKERLKGELQDAKAAFNDYRTSVSQAIAGGIDFSAIAPEFDENGQRVGMTFIEALNQQAAQAQQFAVKVKELVALGLSQAALTQVLEAGVQAGTNIANELITGGASTIEQTNALVASTQAAADEVGQLAATAFYNTGVKNAQDTYDGFKANFGEGGPARVALEKLMDRLAASLNRTSTITVTTINRTVNEAVGVAGKRAAGGPVMANKAYLVGERGPEMLVMGGQSGMIVPNHELPMASGGYSAGKAAGSSPIYLTVNAGMGTQGAEVGRQIVDALKAYERRNGAVYVAA